MAAVQPELRALITNNKNNMYGGIKGNLQVKEIFTLLVTKY
jgi:hypothetical protein